MRLSDFFERRTRADGITFTLRESRPDWLYDAVMAAHDDELPNDWRYATCAAIASWIDDQEADSVDLDDSPNEIADSLTAVYNGELVAWLADDLARADYADQIAGEFGHDETLLTQLRYGQHECIRRMAESIIAAMMEAEDASEVLP